MRLDTCAVVALAPTKAVALTATDALPSGTRAEEGMVMSLESHRRRTSVPLGAGAWRSNVIVRVTVVPTSQARSWISFGLV